MAAIYYAAILLLSGGSIAKLNQKCNCALEAQNVILKGDKESLIYFRETGKRCILKLNVKLDFTDSLGSIGESYKISLYRTRGLTFSTTTKSNSYTVNEIVKLKKGEGAWLILKAENRGTHTASLSPILNSN